MMRSSQRRYIIIRVALVTVLVIFIYNRIKSSPCVTSDPLHVQEASSLRKNNPDNLSVVTREPTPSSNNAETVDVVTSETLVTVAPFAVKTDANVYSPTYLNWTDINPYILDLFRLKPNEPRNYFINDHNFKYSLNSKACYYGTTFLTLVIHSAPRNIGRRLSIRSTFGSAGTYRGKNLTVVFMVGIVSHSFLQELLIKESLLYDDIVQGNFYDDYKNLSLKHVMAMDWYQRYCSSVYILKLDDDTFVNPYRTIDYILDLHISGPTLICKIIEGGMPMRDSWSKWHTPVWEYPFPTLPKFCLGFAYITTPETWRLMYDASSKYRAMFMDDVYVSVILAMATNTRKVDFTDILIPCSPVYGLNRAKLNKKAIVYDRVNACSDLSLSVWKFIKFKNEIM